MTAPTIMFEPRWKEELVWNSSIGSFMLSAKIGTGEMRKSERESAQV
jgi:hypothetical protein